MLETEERVMKKSDPQVILAVDDDAIILNTVLSTLKNDYKVVPMPSGRQALDYLQNNNKCDLILLDFHMPDMNGFDVLENVISNPLTKAIPVIFLTGSIDGEGESAALKMGAVDYIMKPIRPQALLTRVNVQLELQQHRRHLERLVAEQTEELAEAYDKLKVREGVILTMLARITDMRDSDTGGHIERTTAYSKVLVEDLVANPKEGYPMSRNLADDIIKSAKLHDLGKIAIPDSVLLKPGRLTPEEFEIIKTHPAHGAQLFEVLTEKSGEDNFLTTAHDIALYHHEKWNGTGYPLNVREFAIPIAARIVAIADVYDALTSARPYKKAFTHEKAVEIICDDSGIHFDPYLVRVFCRHSKEFEEISHSGRTEE
jgi:putative two-component system response regulator